eukprot:Skav232573  [mRNA]  locus=scaffold1594:263193:263620:+ [translate_table: standard]
MPESCSPVSAEEEAEGMVKLKDLKKEFEQEEGEVSAALDELDADIDHVVEEEANETENADSALQVGLSDSSKAALAPPKKNKRPPLLPVLLATATTVGDSGHGRFLVTFISMVLLDTVSSVGIFRRS